jgi:hypothetical protein
VRPSHKLIRAGESFNFEASVVDARGCRLGIVPSFRLEQAAPNVSVSPNGKVSIEEGAAEGKLNVVAAVGARSVSVVLDIVSKERYEALLAQGGFDPSGASTDAAVARLESGSVGARSTVVEDDSNQRRTLFVGIVGAAALGLGLVGLMLVRRSRKKAREQAPRPAASAQSAPLRHAPGMVCPTCRDEYPPGEIFCAKDGNRLVPLERGTAVGPTGSVCPICGQGYDPGITVCPKHDEPLGSSARLRGACSGQRNQEDLPSLRGTVHRRQPVLRFVRGGARPGQLRQPRRRLTPWRKESRSARQRAETAQSFPVSLNFCKLGSEIPSARGTIGNGR